MGIRVADFVDKEEMDVHEGKGVEDLLMYMVMGEDGEVSEEADEALKDYQQRCKEYNTKRKELHAESYENLVLWFYQMENRGMFTSEEFIQKVRDLKKETKEKRDRLAVEYFPANKNTNNTL